MELEDYGNEIETSVEIIRLVDGTDLIADCFENINEENFALSHVVLIEPMRVVYIIKENGKLSLNLIPWMYQKMVDQQMFSIYLKDILTLTSPSDTLYKYYVQCVEMYATNSNGEKRPGKDVTASLTVEDEIKKLDSYEPNIQDNTELNNFVKDSLDRISKKPRKKQTSTKIRKQPKE